MTAPRPRLLNRQKLLLNLVRATGGECGSLDFQMLLFLFCANEGASTYEFVPYQFGAFSFTCDADRRKLVERGYLQDARHWRLAPDAEVEDHLTSEVNEFVGKTRLRGDALVASTYRLFPYFATRSTIAERVLEGEEDTLRRIDDARPQPSVGGLFTIGYEGRSLESYLNALLQAGVTMLCDIRRNPLSRKYGFSKRALGEACEKLGIAYVHMPSLGIASAERRQAAADDDYRGLFERYAQTTLRSEAARLDQIREWVRRGESVALTCYEEEPEQCHRHCVADAMQELVPTHL